MNKGKVRSLVVRPIRSSDLTFERSGVLASYAEWVTLGQDVQATNDRDALNRILSGNKDGLPSNSAEITGVLEEQALAMLRSTQEAVDLDALVLEYQSRLLSGFRNLDELSTIIAELHRKRGELLTAQLGALEEKSSALQSAYGQQAVVTKTKAVSAFAGNTAQLTEHFLAPLSMQTPSYKVVTTMPGATSTSVYDPTVVRPLAVNSEDGNVDTEVWRTRLSVKYDPAKEVPPQVQGFLSQVDRATSPPQELATDLVDYRYPRLEQLYEDCRDLLSTHEQVADHRLSQRKVDNIKAVLSNELEIARARVLRAQIAFSECSLRTPISGLVTAIYKDPGEFVRAGEPVLRVEDDSTLLVVGHIQVKGLVAVNSRVKISIQNVAESGDSVELAGRIVVVRGHSSDDDEWDVTICIEGHHKLSRRRSNGEVVGCRLPLNLHLDHLGTSVELEV